MTLPPEVVEISAEGLAREMRTLLAVDKPAAIFSVGPFDAYTLIAALQGASRNPSLTDTQRALVVDCARQIADQLTAMAVAILGPGSLVERTTEMGFDTAFDVPWDAPAPGKQEHE